MIFYIADTHFNHENILELEARPFGNVDEMNATIINNWNSCVSEKDTVYVLGDAFWGKEDKSIEIMNRLNGHKHLIVGNHDKIQGRLKSYWESVSDYAEITDDNRMVVLSHYPILFYKNQKWDSVMLYGHVHKKSWWQMIEKWKSEQHQAGIKSTLINVGCMMEYMNYTPRTLDELLAKTKTIDEGK